MKGRIFEPLSDGKVELEVGLLFVDVNEFRTALSKTYVSKNTHKTRAANGVISAKTMYQKILTKQFIINHELSQCHKDNITKWLAAMRKANAAC
jgi:hypothetical protein